MSEATRMELKNQVVLVNSDDRILGFMDKMKAHQKGHLHRALSVFIFNSKGQMLLQKRAAGKYHSGGLWTNTCCSHPMPFEDVIHAAHRRLREEMTLSADLSPLFSFQYLSYFDNGLIEHELDHVFYGISDNAPILNEEEADEWRYVSKKQLTDELIEHPEQFTSWFRICVSRVYDELDAILHDKRVEVRQTA